jgi:hypothetical protein
MTVTGAALAAEHEFLRRTLGLGQVARPVNGPRLL